MLRFLCHCRIQPVVLSIAVAIMCGGGRHRLASCVPGLSVVQVWGCVAGLDHDV